MDPFDPQLNPAQQGVGGFQPPSPEEERKAKRFWIVTNLMPSLITAHPEMSPTAVVSRARMLADELLKDA